jgi:hypothetical protein
MNDKKYSITSFENEMLKNKSATVLSRELEQEVNNELHDVILEKMQEIVNRINSSGHDLQLYYPSQPGDISYRDESSGECKLRVSVDCVISVGYSDVVG